MFLTRAICALAVALLLSGCITHRATPAVQGKAYVVSGSIFGTKVYNCDASGPQPECWQVVEEKRPR